MNLQFSTAMDLNQIREDAAEAQTSVIGIIDREEEIKAKLEELAVLAKPDRMEAAARLILESEGLVEIHKALKSQVNTVQKRIEKISETLRVETLKEIGKNDEYETDGFLLKRKYNVPSVVVEDLSKVPKEWRTEPSPPPSWKEWAPDKNAIKKALVSKIKKSIPGVSLARKISLVIKKK